MGPTLNDLHDKIPYFKSLGVTYVHLMPLYDAHLKAIAMEDMLCRIIARLIQR